MASNATPMPEQASTKHSGRPVNPTQEELTAWEQKLEQDRLERERQREQEAETQAREAFTKGLNPLASEGGTHGLTTYEYELRRRRATMLGIAMTLGVGLLLGLSLAKTWSKAVLRTGFTIELGPFGRTLGSRSFGYPEDAMAAVVSSVGLTIFSIVLCLPMLWIHFQRLQYAPTSASIRHYLDEAGNLDRSAARWYRFKLSGFGFNWHAGVYGHTLTVLNFLQLLSVVIAASIWRGSVSNFTSEYAWAHVDLMQPGYLLLTCSTIVAASASMIEGGIQSDLYGQAGDFVLLKQAGEIPAAPQYGTFVSGSNETLPVRPTKVQPIVL